MARGRLACVLALCLLGNAFCVPVDVPRLRRGFDDNELDSDEITKGDLVSTDSSVDEPTEVPINPAVTLPPVTNTYEDKRKEFQPSSIEDDDDDFPEMETASSTGGGSNILSLLNLLNGLFPSSGGANFQRLIRNVIRQYLKLYPLQPLVLPQNKLLRRQGFFDNEIEIDDIFYLIPPPIPFQRQESNEVGSETSESDSNDTETIEEDFEETDEDNAAEESSENDNDDDGNDDASNDDDGNDDDSNDDSNDDDSNDDSNDDDSNEDDSHEDDDEGNNEDDDDNDNDGDSNDDDDDANEDDSDEGDDDDGGSDNNASQQDTDSEPASDGNGDSDEENDSDYDDEPPGGGDGQGGGILGILAGLSGDDGQSDLGSLLATISGIVVNLSGDGIDVNSLIASGIGLFAGLLSEGEENPGSIIASYLLTSLDTITGGGSKNNGAFFGKFLSKLISGTSAGEAPEGASDESGEPEGMKDSAGFVLSLLMGLSGDMSKTSSAGSSKPWQPQPGSGGSGSGSSPIWTLKMDILRAILQFGTSVIALGSSSSSNAITQ